MWDAPQKDLLPLPVPHADSDWWRQSLPPPAWSNSELWRLRNCLHGINALYSARATQALAPRSAVRGRISSAQRSAIRSVATRMRIYGSQPSEFEPEECLRQLLQSKDLYSQEPQNIASYCFSKLKVLKGHSVPKDACALLPPEAAGVLNNFHVTIERPLDEVPPDVSLPKPYWDPILANDPQKKFELFSHLLHLHSKAMAGLFFLCAKKRWLHQDGR